MYTEEQRKKVAKWLNSQGYGLDLEDDFWMEEFDFQEHKTKDVIDLMLKYNEFNPDCTFGQRLKAFVTNIEVNDLPGEEEKQYLLSVAEGYLSLIPERLNKEILLKLGFDKIDSEEGPFFLLEVTEDIRFCVLSDMTFQIDSTTQIFETTLSHIKYVHEVQNLYQGLTGRLLTIKQ